MSPAEWIAVLGAFTVLLGAIGKLYLDVRSVHVLINSRMTELLELTRLSSAAEGRLEGYASKSPPEHGLGALPPETTQSPSGDPDGL